MEETKRVETLKDIAESLTRPRSKLSHSHLNKENEVTPTRESDSQDKTPSKAFHTSCKDKTDSSQNVQIRGDPDECGLEEDVPLCSPVTDTQRVDLPAEDILHIKKGWLLKQGFSQEWSKHWFVLEKSGLKFYRDPSSEANGILDGIIDLVLVKNIQEKEVGRNYGFVVTTWDDKKLVFSGITSGIRANWIQAMRNAANLKEPPDRHLTLGERLEREIRSNTGFVTSMDDDPESANIRINISSEESFKSASESFQDDITTNSLPNDDRLTSRPSTRISPFDQRSRSSPPPSRRGTRDDIVLHTSTSNKMSLSEADSVASVQDLGRHHSPERIAELTKEVSRLKESLKNEKSEVYKWKDLVNELRSLLEGRSQDFDAKRDEVNSLREKLRETQSELASTADRLQRGIEENESLCQRVLELERRELSTENSQGKDRVDSSSMSISGSREKFCSKRNLPRMDSLSDLTNFELHCDPEKLEKESLIDEYHALRLRLEKAVCEILALKREFRVAESAQDDIELTNQRLRDELRIQRDDFHSQMSLMSTRVQDLTSKLSVSEKQVRALKLKVTRTESRERRRSLSLKGKESFVLSKDLESKLSQLEARVDSLSNADRIQGQNKCGALLSEARRSKSFEEAPRRTRQRRKSLEGQATSHDALDVVVRINALEGNVSDLVGKDYKQGSNTSLSSANAENDNTKSSLGSPADPRKTFGSRAPKINFERGQKLTDDRPQKLTRSESEPQLPGGQLSTLESILVDVQTKVNEMEAYARVLQATCSCRSDLLLRLRELLAETSRLALRRHEREAIKRVKPLAQLLQELLMQRLAKAATRRQDLRIAGKWTKEEQTKALADRLAWETVLLAQVAQATQKAQHPKAYEASLRFQDLAEAHRKISFLEKALTNPEFDMEPMTPLEFNTTLLAEKLVVTGDLLETLKPPAESSSVGDSYQSSGVPLTSFSATCRDLLNKVLERERSLADFLTKYKEKKLQEIAALMATDSVQGIMVDESLLPEELRLRKTWNVSQKILTQEVASLEASQSVLRMAHLLGPPGTMGEPLACQQGRTEILQKAAEESLRQEMEESVFILSAKYEAVLALVREGDTSALTCVRGKKLSKALCEFAAVIAQKALIDGQLALATGEGVAEVDNPLVVEERADPKEAAQDIVVSESHLLMFLGGCDAQLEQKSSFYISQAELAFIFSRVSSQEALKPYRAGEMDSPMLYSPKFKRRVGDGISSIGRRCRRTSDVTGMLTTVCKGCEDLQEEVKKLQKKLSENKRLMKKDTDCVKCMQDHQALKRLQDDHRQAMKTLRSQHEDEISRLRDQVKFDPPTRDSDDELTELKRRLCLLEEGYEAQISALKKQYHEALGSQSDVCEENIRQRYQHEIKHLRDLCEKGLTAMESSHRRLISEMQAKHRRELELLQAEKEEALAEETQATLAALDAMRKAHQAEVQKEVAKFKEEFLRHEKNLRQENPGVGEFRREILTLSEKYSAKCLEAAVAEQKAESLTKLLNEARAQGRALEERNRMLKQKMSGHIIDLKNQSERNPKELKHQFECEIALKDEEISCLNQMLQKSKKEKVEIHKLEGSAQLNIRERL